MFYRGSIPPPLTITPKFNYMEKELLTIELSHHDLAPETITIGIYDTIDEAVKEGNKALELLSRYFEVRKGDFFKTRKRRLNTLSLLHSITLLTSGSR